MTSFALRVKTHLKTSQHPLTRRLRDVIRGLLYSSGPNLPWLYRSVRVLVTPLAALARESVRMLYHTPMFKTQLVRPPASLMLYGGQPQVLGALHIHIGENCRISGATTFSGRAGAISPPSLTIGDNCDIGWQTGIAVGTEVRIGNNVRIAGRSTLAGYPGHPLNAQRRARGEPDDDHQAGPIVLEDDVWLATGVNVMAGVRIGRGTVVACGSVVTRDLPANVLAGGVPAKVIRSLEQEQ
ncbi:acyltransferase [Marinobacter hydrocarbonoclasticus]|nr:acyltransferase [Marinobacter nauticus]